MSAPTGPTPSPHRNLGLWVQCVCTALVAAGAAYASYRHGRAFASRFGADSATATIWPLIVDGLLTTATVELWKSGHGQQQRWSAWLAFGFGIVLSLCANVASAPTMSVFSIAVAACPPLALLLAVELLNKALKRHRETTTETRHSSETETTEIPETGRTRDSGKKVTETDDPWASLSVVSGKVPDKSHQPTATTAKLRMWTYYQAQRAAGRTPTGAELDRVAGTNNYGRRLLRKWRKEGGIRVLPDQPLPARLPTATTHNSHNLPDRPLA